MIMETSTQDTDEIVQVPVPRRHLTAVYRALAESMGTAAGTPPPTVPPTLMGGNQQLPVVPWTAADLKRLKEMIRTPTPRVVLDMTTERLGERIPLQAIAKRAGRTRDQARADLGGLTQLVRRRFGRNNWPFEVEWMEGGFATYYCESPEIARWWKEAPHD
jgi:hypothetical protein